MHPAAPGPNAAPRTRIPPPRRWPGPHLPLRHGTARHDTARLGSARSGPVRPGPILLSSPGTARRGPSGLRGGSRSLTGGTQRRPRPCLRTANHCPVSLHDPAPHPVVSNHRAVHALTSPPGAALAGCVSQKWAGLSAKQAPPRGLSGGCRSAHARSAAGGGVGSGRRSHHDRPPCWPWLWPVPGPAGSLGSFGQGATDVLRSPRSHLGGTSVPQ